MDGWEQRDLRRILREELTDILDTTLQPLLVGMFAELLAAGRNTQGACGTAREAPTAAESTAAMRVTDSAPSEAEASETAPPATSGGAASAAPPAKRARAAPRPESAPISGTDRAGGLSKDDAGAATPSTGGAAPSVGDIDPASIGTAHPFIPPCIPIRPRSSPLVRIVVLDPDRPIAASREGCGRCGVRGDLGCTHQRPFGTAE